MLVYSVASKQSFEIVKIIRGKLLNHIVSYKIVTGPWVEFETNGDIAQQGSDWVPIVLVGNKSDLHIQRQVTAEEGKALQQEWNCAWIETSARHNENVTKAFELMIVEVEKAQNPTQTSPTTCSVM